MSTAETLPILAINSGSSSLKFALFECGNQPPSLLARGAIERIGLAGGSLRIIRGSESHPILAQSPFKDHRAAMKAAFDRLKAIGLPRLAAAGHRVVHGGPDFSAPVRIDAQVLDQLRRLTPFAPLHQPGALAGIEAVSERFPDLPQVACFDTAFHRRIPELAQRLPLPRSLWDEGLRRYGFHGLSYEYILSRLNRPVPERLIIAQLGNGVSLAAIQNGSPIDTTMGFTPAGGCMMGTRCGDLDPGVLLYLLTQKSAGPEEVDRMVNRESGLLGVSGISPDMKTLLELEAERPAAAQAIEMFCYQLRKEIGSLAAALGGLDLLVFSGGIGEQAAAVRRRICEPLAFLGLDLDPKRNAAHEEIISSEQSRCPVHVIPTNEDLMIARHVYQLLFA